MTKKAYAFNISERLLIGVLLNGFKGNLADTALVFEDFGKLRVTDDEFVHAERTEVLKKLPDGQEVSYDPALFTWDNEKGGTKDIELSVPTKEFLVKTIKEKDEKGEFSVTDPQLRWYQGIATKLS